MPTLHFKGKTFVQNNHLAVIATMMNARRFLPVALRNLQFTKIKHNGKSG